MKVLMPPKHLCKKMHKLLNTFYENEKNNKRALSIDNYKMYREAFTIFCNWYELEVPVTNFKKKIDKTKSLGECTESGKIILLYPYVFNKRKQKEKLSCTYLGLVFHEWGHYYLWADAETKALEFELRMIKRGK